MRRLLVAALLALFVGAGLAQTPEPAAAEEPTASAPVEAPAERIEGATSPAPNPPILSLTNLLVLGGLIVTLVVGLMLVHWLLFVRQGTLARLNRLTRQVIMLVATFIGIITVIRFVPGVDTQFKGDVFKVLGLLISAAFALSSATFVSNAMAGLMLRSVRNFRTGDFIRVQDQFGRVTERGLFHTEIQNEDRDLTTLPNLFLVANPVKVVRSSGTIISANLSLGYDLPRKTIESLLERAAVAAGLEEPFVYVRGLGDYSVTYYVAGFLPNVKHLVSARSRLRCAVLDELHGAGIEIVSPTFMNQRQIPTGTTFVPQTHRGVADNEGPERAPEELMFDKADQAKRQEDVKRKRDELLTEIVECKKQLKEMSDEAERAALETRVEQRQRACDRLEQILERDKDTRG